jgi:hypothetical protein
MDVVLQGCLGKDWSVTETTNSLFETLKAEVREELGREPEHNKRNDGKKCPVKQPNTLRSAARGLPMGFASGNVFVADYSLSAVKEVLTAGGYTTVNPLGSGVSGTGSDRLRTGEGRATRDWLKETRMSKPIESESGSKAVTLGLLLCVITLPVASIAPPEGYGSPV